MNACGIFSKVSPVCLARTLTSLALLNPCSLCSTFSFKVSPASDKSYRGLLCVCSAALCSRLSESSPPPPRLMWGPLCAALPALQCSSRDFWLPSRFCGTLCSACFSSLCTLLGTLYPGTEQGQLLVLPPGFCFSHHHTCCPLTENSRFLYMVWFQGF